MSADYISFADDVVLLCGDLCVTEHQLLNLYSRDSLLEQWICSLQIREELEFRCLGFLFKGDGKKEHEMDRRFSEGSADSCGEEGTGMN